MGTKLADPKQVGSTGVKGSNLVDSTTQLACEQLGSKNKPWLSLWCPMELTKVSDEGGIPAGTGDNLPLHLSLRLCGTHK